MENISEAHLGCQMEISNNPRILPSPPPFRYHIFYGKGWIQHPQALQSLKELQNRCVFAAHFGGSNLALNDAIMLQAHKLDLIQGEGCFVWVFSDGIVANLAAKRFEKNSPLYLPHYQETTYLPHYQDLPPPPPKLIHNGASKCGGTYPLLTLSGSSALSTTMDC
jgi:hypothetical protein